MSKQYQNECLDLIASGVEMQEAALTKINEFFERNPDLKNPISGALADFATGLNVIEYHQQQVKASLNQQELKRA